MKPLLELKSNGPFTIGVDVGGTKTAVGVVNSQMNLAGKRENPTKKASVDAVVEGIVDTVYEVLNESNMALSSVVGIGIGIPGRVDIKEGTVLSPVSLKWQSRIPLKCILEKIFNVPIVVDNDVRTAAYGEKYRGAGVGCDNFVYITIGTGVAAAIVINGKLYCGASGGAGELGHTSIDRHGSSCSCGNRGCVESIIAGPAVEVKAKRAIKEGIKTRINTMALDDLQKVTAEMVFEAARTGDHLAINIIEQFIRNTGLVLTNIVNFLDPELIIIGGGIGQATDLFLKPLEDMVRTNTLFPVLQKVMIVPALLGVDAGIIGAGVLAHDMGI